MAAPFFRSATTGAADSPVFSRLVPNAQPMWFSRPSDEALFPSLDQMAAVAVPCATTAKPWDPPTATKPVRSSSLVANSSPLRMVMYPQAVAGPVASAEADGEARSPSPMDDEQMVPSPPPQDATRRPTPYPFIPVPAAVDTVFPADNQLRGGGGGGGGGLQATRNHRTLFPIVEMDEDC
jgi:hypothetical protein